ncbi:MAG: class I tRNA ligase family protein [Candidatus Dormibacteraceae bacterium]
MTEPAPETSVTQIWDSRTRALVRLPTSEDPEREGRRLLRLYVCGVTPYDSGHLGHAFTFLCFDLLIRWAEAQGVRVHYIQNVTDVDDPLFERARRDGVRWDELGEREVRLFTGDMATLGWRPPDHMPRVSQEIDAIKDAVQQLLAQGFAYRTDSVYFDVDRYPGFGELSHRTRRSMLGKLRDEGLLGEVSPEAQRGPLDFTLWRPSRPGEPAWSAPFGEGRPGWHIECTAMSRRYLGPQLDVHGGGRDLIFSHHESERAQSESLQGEAPFARAWMHTGMVRYEGRKMSKSLGNLVVVRQLLERMSPAAARLALLSHHYRRDWEWSWERSEQPQRLVADVAALVGRAPLAGAGRPPGELPDAFAAALDADLDTAGAIRALRRAVTAGDAGAARWMGSILLGAAALA